MNIHTDFNPFCKISNTHTDFNPLCKFRIFTPTSIHFVNFRIFTLISIHFVKFRIFTLTSIRFINFRINSWASIHMIRRFAFYDCSILISLINSFFKKRIENSFFGNHRAAICRIRKNAAFWLAGKILLIHFVRINKLNVFAGDLPTEN